jgi:putative transposase
VKHSIGGSVHDPTDPVGRLLFNVLAMVAEFEFDLIRLRTTEGMRVAKAKGRLRGKSPSPTRVRRRTSSRCTTPPSTAPPSSPTCLASRDPRSTEPSNATPNNT